MAISKILTSVIFCAAVHTSQAAAVAGPGKRASESMMMAKGWPPIASKCGLHDFYAKFSSEASEVIADCSVKGDIRADSAQLKQCLEECCGVENCIGISARSTGAKLVQSFVYAHPDNSADSYMLHEISQMVLNTGDAGKIEAVSTLNSDAFTMSSAMANARGFPPMAAKCGRHDYYGEIGSKAASAFIGDCSAKGDIRKDFAMLQRCLNECCGTDSCVGITSTAEGTKFVQSFAEAEVNEAANSYMLNPKHRKQPELTAKKVSSEETAKAKESAEESAETEDTEKAEDTSKVGVAAAMTRVKSWPSVGVSCGKVYDFYGGIAGKPSAELGDCFHKGDIRKDYAKLKTCMEMCCNTDKCVGITASAKGTKLIESFAAVEEDEDRMSYMQKMN